LNRFYIFFFCNKLDKDDSKIVNKSNQKTNETDTKSILINNNSSSTNKNAINVKKNNDKNEPPQREIWSKKFDFLMSIIGFSVDLASVWRL
jgi:hypothetical protein